MNAGRLAPTVLGVLVLITACSPAAGPPRAPDQASAPAQTAQPRQPKALTISLQGEPAALDLLLGGDVGGSPGAEMSLALSERLSNYDNKGTIFAQLADDLPSLDKSTWLVNPDNTMETTYHLRPNIRWHD